MTLQDRTPDTPPTDDVQQQYLASRNRIAAESLFYNLPLWLFILIAGWLMVIYAIRSDELYSSIFNQLVAGVGITLRVTVMAYGMALILGLLVGLVRSNTPKPARGFGGRVRSLIHMLLYNVATVYVEVMRGLPILIVLVFGAFVIFPEIRDAIFVPIFGQEYVSDNMSAGSPVPAILGLGLAYGAFMSETVRAGIQSIERGQMEAARSLGMNYVQAMRFIILPQAIRRVLPSLGNDFIAMIKDSSLVSVLGIRDITQIARVSSGRSFRYVETYLTVAFLYLTLTVVGSFLVKGLERSLRQQAGKSDNGLIRLWLRINRWGRSMR